MALAPAEMFLDKSAKWYVDFINTLPMAVFRESTEGKILFCNDAMAEIFGFNSFRELLDYPVINFYRNREDRDSLLDEFHRKGRVVDLHVPFKRRDSRPIWCSVTAQAVVDRYGHLVHLDGLMRDVTSLVEKRGGGGHFKRKEDAVTDFVVLLAEEGDFVDINAKGAELLGLKPEDLIGRSIFDFIAPRFRDLVSTHLSIILERGREEGILTILNREGEEQHLEFRAFVEKSKGGSRHVQLMASNVTERIKHQKEQLSKEKFLGVLEMAGGVAHKLNQPLTIVRNMVMEMLSELPSDGPHHEKMERLQHQIERIYEIAKKLGNIKTYQPMEYVAGIKIVDIDKTS
ncbi:MAG: PAS domain S-box protein [Proteobacteria bacterium]|nr:PAS domain S-box protein [Pseudomonadota bacterium]